MWIVTENTKPKTYSGLFTTKAAAKTHVETVVAEGLDITRDTMYEDGWRWLVPQFDATEGGHLIFANVEAPALSVEVFFVPIVS